MTGGRSGLEPCPAHSAGPGCWSRRSAAAPPPACAGRPAPQPEPAALPSAPRSEPALCRGPRPAPGSSPSAPRSPPPGLGCHPPSGEPWWTGGPSAACAAPPPAVLLRCLDLKSIKGKVKNGAHEGLNGLETTLLIRRHINWSCRRSHLVPIKRL